MKVYSISVEVGISVYVTKQHCKRTIIRKYQRNYCKSNKSTGSVIEKWFPGMLPKALQTVAKVSHCPRELL
jgi:hypothetical protein